MDARVSCSAELRPTELCTKEKMCPKGPRFGPQRRGIPRAAGRSCRGSAGRRSGCMRRRRCRQSGRRARAGSLTVEGRKTSAQRSRGTEGGQSRAGSEACLKGADAARCRCGTARTPHPEPPAQSLRAPSATLDGPACNRRAHACTRVRVVLVHGGAPRSPSRQSRRGRRTGMSWRRRRWSRRERRRRTRSAACGATWPPRTWRQAPKGGHPLEASWRESAELRRLLRLGRRSQEPSVGGSGGCKKARRVRLRGRSPGGPPRA
eukprot:3090240-Prymnesium_polylepis.4